MRRHSGLSLAPSVANCCCILPPILSGHLFSQKEGHGKRLIGERQLRLRDRVAFCREQ